MFNFFKKHANLHILIAKIFLKKMIEVSKLLMKSKYNIQIISAPSILGLKPAGVEYLGKSLLASGLAENLGAKHTVVHVPRLNNLYSKKRDPETNCLNAKPLRDFSINLSKAVTKAINQNRFAFILGGDCSILLGAMAAMKAKVILGLFS